jgi:ATP-GRASP peptide maturase of grasp-with-spasm system
MILILSKVCDVPIKLVVSHLDSQKVPYFLLLESDIISDISVEIDSLEVKIFLEINGEKSLSFSNIRAYWYRNGFFPLFTDFRYNDALFKKFHHYIDIEQRHLTFFLHKYLNSIPSIGSFLSEIYSNKLVNLTLAKKAGLQIPNTFVIQKKTQLTEIFANNSIITKAIQREMYYADEKYEYFTYGTQEINLCSLYKFPHHFPPSLIQEKIEKEYEIRSYYLLGKFYSMILFSQEDVKTSIDCRRFNEQKPIRCEPHILPKKIEKKMRLLLSWLQLNTGSFDLIYTREGNYIFLEINPSGQYHFLSESCNYQIDKKIAQFLIEKYNSIN